MTIRKNKYPVPTVYMMGDLMAQKMTNGTLALSVFRSLLESVLHRKWSKA